MAQVCDLYVTIYDPCTTVRGDGILSFKTQSIPFQKGRNYTNTIQKRPKDMDYFLTRYFKNSQNNLRNVSKDLLLRGRMMTHVAMLHGHLITFADATSFNEFGIKKPGCFCRILW